MAESTIRRVRFDERRGASVGLPKFVAEALPEDAELHFEIEDDRIVMTVVELTRKPAKLKQPKE